MVNYRSYYHMRWWLLVASITLVSLVIGRLVLRT